MADTRYLLILQKDGDRLSVFSRSFGHGELYTRVRDVIGPVMSGTQVRLHTDSAGTDRLMLAFEAELRGRDGND